MFHSLPAFPRSRRNSTLCRSSDLLPARAPSQLPNRLLPAGRRKQGGVLPSPSVGRLCQVLPVSGIGCSTFFTKLTAAGLSGILTRFPFNPASQTATSEQSEAKIEKFSGKREIYQEIFRAGHFNSPESMIHRGYTGLTYHSSRKRRRPPLAAIRP